MKSALKTESIPDPSEQILESIREDIKRRKLESLEQINLLILRRAEKLAELRAVGAIDGQLIFAMALQKQVSDIDYELARFHNHVLPGYDQELESIIGGYHPRLAAQSFSKRTNAERSASDSLEASKAEFKAACTRELIEVAKRNVQAHKALLITPPEVAVLISQLPTD